MTKLEGLAVSDLARLLVIAEEARGLDRPLSARDLTALCYLLENDDAAGELTCSYRYRFEPGPSSSDFDTDLTQLEAAGYAERRSPIFVSDRGRAWLLEASRSIGVQRLRELARTVLPRYLGSADLVTRSLVRSAEIAGRALARDRERARQLSEVAAR
jgi:hypothetical protein